VAAEVPETFFDILFHMCRAETIERISSDVDIILHGSLSCAIVSKFDYLQMTLKNKVSATLKFIPISR